MASQLQETETLALRRVGTRLTQVALSQKTVRKPGASTQVSTPTLAVKHP